MWDSNTMSINNVTGTGWSWAAALLPQMDQLPLYNQIDFNSLCCSQTPPTPGEILNAELIKTPLPFIRCPSDTAPPVALTPTDQPCGNASCRAPIEMATTSYCVNGGSFRGSSNNQTDPRFANGPFMRFKSSPGFQSTFKSIRDFSDGTSNTVLTNESAWAASLSDEPGGAGRVGRKRWYASGEGHNRSINEGFAINPPNSAALNIIRRVAASMHEGGVLFGLADGSVRFISENIDNTGRSWAQRNNPNPDDPFDLQRGGQAYGTYQRLWSMQDGLVIGEF